ncbi:MAG: bacteriohemerythrin [Candidatus Magnetominusculus sp. LBB02]|nr:bacteriohemerythrin [Candidatus Magnetominusculus sp. LBB02]
MEIQWHESLATGVDTIDNQHKEIFARISGLVNMDIENLDPEKKEVELHKVLRFLGGYVLDHFKTEEGFMTQYHYPDYDSHKKEHIEFLKSYSSLVRMFEKEGATDLIVTATQNQAVDWLVKHIKGTDQRLGAFLKSI